MQHQGSILPARRYASAGTSYGPVSVYVCLSVLSVYPTLCFREIQVSTKIGVLPPGTVSQRHIDRRNVLSTWLEKGGSSERDKLDRRRSTKLIIPPSSDSRPLQFITGDRQALSAARYSRAGRISDS